MGDGEQILAVSFTLSPLHPFSHSPLPSFLLFLAGFLPLGVAWFAVRRSSLGHALRWAMAAWLAWGPVLTNDAADESVRIIALSMTACAGVAVLGARRPHVMAWNFVVLGLLVVLLMPLLEGWIVGPRPLSAVRVMFLSVALLAGLGNYLPTCFGPAAALAIFGCGGTLLMQLDIGQDREILEQASRLAMLTLPWLSLACWKRRRTPTSQLDRAWLDFRDRFGLLWSLRVREQFNHALRHAGWPVSLRWNGFLVGDGDVNESAILVDFQAVLKRFVGDDDRKSE